MRACNKVFHLAIPCSDLEATAEFYLKLGCKPARRYKDRITFNFFGDQLVCHLDPQSVDPEPTMYPRHYGITFTERKEFDELLQFAIDQDLSFFQKPIIRFEGKQEEHVTFFLIDPSNNLLEFKWYQDKAMMY